ncbi:MAG TPA: MASE1 domain-containing protein [Alphaproteobacteria bacterium]|jgi:PAS domain S-box-containing protein|nr:MASE1 domain-containing protein [Alphaproteobacteria bacterium]
MQDKFKYILQIILLAGVYFVAAKFGLSLAFGVKQVTLVWPPTGIAIAALLLFDKKLWPGILLGAFFANITTNETFTTASQIAIGNTLEALTAWYFLNKLKFDKEFHHIEDIAKFIVWGAIVPTIVSATIGTLTLAFSGTIGWQVFHSTWLTWWLGDTTGAILFAPLILSFKDIKVFPFSFKKMFEFIALIASTSFTSILIFTGYISPTFSIYPTKYIVFPFMIWAALSFGVPGATWISLLISVISILGFKAGSGPFANLGNPEIGLTLLQLLMAVFSVTSTILAAALDERKRSEGKFKESETRFRALIENSYEAIILVDAKGTIVYTSPSVKRILGFTSAELENTNGFNLIHKDDKIRLAKILAELIVKPGKTVQVENKIVKKDGEVRWMEAVGTNLLQEEGVGAIVINFRDITDHKKLDETKSEFVSLAAHELRSPISNIRWYTESLLKTKPSKYLNEIYSSTLKMTSLINTLLTVNKVELGKLTYEPEKVDLVTIVKDITQNIKIEKNLPEKLEAFADPNLLRIILENLINNAVKYSPGDKKISINVKEVKEKIHIEVKDFGIGIPKNQQDKIFTKLFRADNVKKTFPDGTGLGLYLVKAVVDKLKGEIWFESEENKGTTFFVDLPKKII